MDRKIKVGVVGLSFGMEFVAIYKKHPDVSGVVVADTDERLLKIAQEKFGFKENECFTEVLLNLINIFFMVKPPEYNSCVLLLTP